MYYKGINHWKIPLSKNAELVIKINNLIHSELIAENIMGD